MIVVLVEKNVRKLYFKTIRLCWLKIFYSHRTTISKAKRQFKKGYMANWTEELFTIVDVHLSEPPVYRLADWYGERLEGTPKQSTSDPILCDLDAKMTSIIDRPDIDVSEKVRLYNQTLLRYNDMTKTHVGPVRPNDNDRTYSPRKAFVHRQSCEGVKSELDLFAVPPTQTSIEVGGWIETPTIDISRLGWSDIIHLGRNRRCVSRSRQHISTRTRENNERTRNRHWRRYTGGTCEQRAPFSLQPGGRIPERHARNAIVEHLPVSLIRRDLIKLRRRGEENSTYQPTVVQGHGWPHAGYNHKCRQSKSG